jgi:hypothetical protein
MSSPLIALSFQLPEPMETVTEETKPATPAAAPAAAAATKPEEPVAPLPLQPEVEIYLRLVATIALLDNKLNDAVRLARFLAPLHTKQRPNALR